MVSSAFSQDVVGKLVVGYQGWFACQGDGSPRNTWVHWSAGTQPSPGNQKFELYPDVREYTNTYQTGYANLGNGQPAKLFASYDDQVVNTHFEWMRHYEIDCAAVQRFGSELSNSTVKSQRDGIANKVKNASEAYGRKFYIMYDIGNWTSFETDIKSDWNNTIKGVLNLTASPAYAKENNKPVVCIWGIGVSGRPGNVTSWNNIIDWFKGQGCYVIVGTSKTWRTQTVNLAAYNSADMISPWSVGAYNSNDGADVFANGYLVPDKAYCDGHSIDYQPVVFPGFAWFNWNGGTQNQIPRNHGDFMWRQFYNIKNSGISNAYVAMFDEYDEGTAIAKAAENSSMKPTNQYFLTLDADGKACSSDFYLRLTSDGAKMVKGQIGLTSTHPTSHTYLDACNNTNGWISSNTLTLNASSKKEGTGSLQSNGSATDEFKKVFTAYNTGLTAANATLRFWYYVSDVTKLGTSNQVELGSGGAADVNEYNWSITGLVNGWNKIDLKISSATKLGTPNLSAITWFRIYRAKAASITVRLDAIEITSITALSKSPAIRLENIEANIISGENEFRLYPNPISEQSMLNIKLNNKEEALSVRILNMNGQVVYSRNLNSVSTLDLSTKDILKRGSYIVSLTSKSSVINKVLIVK